MVGFDLALADWRQHATGDRLAAAAATRRRPPYAGCGDRDLLGRTPRADGLDRGRYCRLGWRRLGPSGRRSPRGGRGADPTSDGRKGRPTGGRTAREGLAVAAGEVKPLRYVTRAKVHVDRIATAWAIRRFIDPAATFVFVDRNTDVSALDAIAFDMRGAELGHHGGRCTFEVLLDSYELRDPALRRMGQIVRTIDVPLDSARTDEVAPWMVAFNEIRDADLSDEERLLRGGLICEALYVNCGGSQKEFQQ